MGQNKQANSCLYVYSGGVLDTISIQQEYKKNFTTANTTTATDTTKHIKKCQKDLKKLLTNKTI